MKAIYVSPSTTIIKTEESRLLAGSLSLSTEKNTVHLAGPETDTLGVVETGGDETHSGGDNLEAAKRNWNCWDVE